MKNTVSLNLGESAYSRQKSVTICKANTMFYCDYCKTVQKLLMSFDTSGGEYGDVAVCKDCITDLFTKIETGNVIEECIDETDYRYHNDYHFTSITNASEHCGRKDCDRCTS